MWRSETTGIGETMPSLWTLVVLLIAALAWALSTDSGATISEEESR